MKLKFINIRLLLIIISALLSAIFLFEQKELFHIDELFSFGTANGENGVYLYQNVEEIDNKLISGKVFQDYLTQTPKSSFKRMIGQLKYDNHMPLYFILLRSVNSFFPNTHFTRTPGVILNLIILCFLITLFYNLCCKLTKDKDISLTLTTLFTFSFYVISLEIYIRMYLLQMMVACSLIIEIIKLLQTMPHKEEYKNFAFLTLISTINILTHFYSIIFCLSLTLAGFVVLFYQKRYYTINKFLLSMLFSAILAYILFPDMIQMGTSGERGGQFMAMLQDYLNRPVFLLKQQLPLFIDSFFHNNIIAFASILLSLIILKIAKQSKSQYYSFETILFFVITFFVYGIFVSMVMPNMSSYKIRYFAPIIPIYFVLLSLVYLNFCHIVKIKKFALCVIILIITGISCYKESKNYNNAFYLNGTLKSRKAEKIVKGADIWWGLGGGPSHSWIIHNYIDKLATAENVWTLVDFDNKEFLKFAKDGKEAKRYAYLMMPKNQEIQPEAAEEWIRKTTNRQGYYMFTLKNEKTAAMAFEASIFLVCPY